MKEMDEWRSYGWPIFGPSLASARWEIERADGMRAFKEAGVDLPEYHEFASLEDAERFAMQAGDPFVFKTLGSEEDKSLTYVANNPADLVGWLRSKQKAGLRLKGKCMLQRKIEGIEMGVSGWMGPEGFIPRRWNENFEYKKLMSGNFGPNTGEQGTVIQYVAESRLADFLLKPFEQALRKLGHIGDFAVGSIIAEDGKPYPTEFTSRPGWPFTQIVQETHRGDPVKWMKDLLDGKDTLEVSTQVGVGVVLSIPPYPRPVEDEDEVVGLPIMIGKEIEEQDWNSIHPWQMMMVDGLTMAHGKIVEDTVFQTTGAYVMVISGTGHRVSEAYKDVFDSVERIKIPNMMVRDDIGEDLEEKMPDLHEHGFALNMRY
jgi:phosphoribosylamine--glycine ligase